MNLQKTVVKDRRIQYDESAKRILAQKSLLALILKYTTEEFQEMTEEEIEDCIEGTPEISSVNVNLDENERGGQGTPKEIHGLSNESAISGEGKVTYDVRFSVWKPGKLQKIKLIVKENRLGENRISRQAYDKLAVVLVGLKPGSETDHRLVQVLNTLFSEDMSLAEKEERLKACDVILTEEARKEADSMCNLGEGIWERGVEAGIRQGLEKGREAGIQQGLEKGREAGIQQAVMQLIRNGAISVEIGAAALGKSTEEMRKLSEESQCVVSSRA